MPSTIEFVDSAPGAPEEFASVAIHLHPDDSIAVARRSLPQGARLTGAPTAAGELVTLALIPSGHKVALRAVPAGGPVRRYGQIIGFATRDIAPGDHVHTHNLGMGDFARDYAFGADCKPVAPAAESRTFMGYHRADGRVGTRNYIAVISTVNCSAHTVRAIAHHFTPERLAAYPNIDGVIAFAHGSGCATRAGSEDYAMLQRVLAGMANHPNVGAYILVGLGCETNQISELVENFALTQKAAPRFVRAAGAEAMDRAQAAPAQPLAPPMFNIEDEGRRAQDGRQGHRRN